MRYPHSAIPIYSNRDERGKGKGGWKGKEKEKEKERAHGKWRYLNKETTMSPILPRRWDETFQPCRAYIPTYIIPT